jgi:hypothetical protein
LESVGGKPDLGLEDELDFVLCDKLVLIDLAVGNVFAMFLDEELRELSDKHRQLARFTVVVSITTVICCGMIHSRLVPLGYGPSIILSPTAHSNRLFSILSAHSKLFHFCLRDDFDDSQ